MDFIITEVRVPEKFITIGAGVMKCSRVEQPLYTVPLAESNSSCT